uniref:Triphosphoribosyl-dephospho-CoA synthase n=1 Tax=Staphylothermus marinus TaxID=2280 RepID=A0A7C4NN62_STAMA
MPLSLRSALPILLSSSIALEASAYPKPGNTHRLSSIEGLPYEAFLITSSLTTEWFIKGVRRGLKGLDKARVVFGDLIYGIVSSTISLTGTNTCLGSATLLTPLSVALGLSLRSKCLDMECIVKNTGLVLSKTTVHDTLYFYKAVRCAKPSHLKISDETGGLVNVWSRDYAKRIIDANLKLIDVFEKSSRVEIVHDELINRYPRSREAAERLRIRFETHRDWNRAVVETYLYLLSENTDTLIARKFGMDQAYYVREKAREVYEQVIYKSSEWLRIVSKLDEEFKLKKLNPGSIADLTVSTIALYLIKEFLLKKNLFISLYKH